MKPIKIIKDIDYYVQPFILAGMLITVALQIVSRFTPQVTLSWTLELVTILMGGLAWFGVSVAIKEDVHIGLTFMVDLFPKKVRKYLKIVQQILFAVFMVWVGFLVYDTIVYYIGCGTKSAALNMPDYIIRLPMVFGCILSVYRLIEKTILIIKDELDY